MEPDNCLSFFDELMTTIPYQYKMMEKHDANMEDTTKQSKRAKQRAKQHAKENKSLSMVELKERA